MSRLALDLTVTGAWLIAAVALVLVAWQYFYLMKLHYHRDLISRLVANRLSLIYDAELYEWAVLQHDSFTDRPVELAAHSRWELAVQQALDVLSTKGSQSRKERSTVGGRPERTDG